MFMPREATLKTIYSYYLSTVNVNPEGDVNLSAEINLKGLGKSVSSLPVSPLCMLPLHLQPSLSLVGRLHSNHNLGYFIAGGVAGAISRTATAPFDRIKVYLIAQTGNSTAKHAAVEAAKGGEPLQAAKKAAGPIRESIRTLWRAGGAKSFFAG